MKFYEQTVVVQAEAETIWDVLADVKNWTDWDGGLQFVQNIGDGLVEDGVSIFVFSGGLKATSKFTNVVENQKFSCISKSMMVRIETRFDIRPVEKGHEVQYQFGLGGFLGTIMNLFMRKTVEFDTLRNLKSLKALAEKTNTISQ